MGTAGIQAPEPSSDAFPGTFEGIGSEARELGLAPGTLIRHAQIPSGDPIHSATMPVPAYFFKKYIAL